MDFYLPDDPPPSEAPAQSWGESEELGDGFAEAGLAAGAPSTQGDGDAQALTEDVVATSIEPDDPPALVPEVGLPDTEAPTDDTPETETPEASDGAGLLPRVRDAGDDTGDGLLVDADARPDADFALEPGPDDGRRSGWWGVGIGTLAMVLLALSALQFRHAIVQVMPETQGFYTGLCEQLGCDMPLPREAGFIAIETSDLRPEPNHQGTFRLGAVIENRAPFRQQLPHLELTLTDARDRAVARKVLTPAEWLPEGAEPDGFAANSRIDADVPFSVSDIAPVGYRVYAFYP